MNTRTLIPVVAVFWIGATVAYAQTDMFWSLSDLNSGAVNAPLNHQFEIGEKSSMYLYFDPMNTNLDTGCFLDISPTTEGIIEFTGGESLCFDITVGQGGPAIGVRWGDIFGEGVVSNGGQLFQVDASNIISGSGMISSNTGPVFFDAGYDIQAGAFQFARVDFQVIGSGETEILIERGAGGIVSNGMSIFPTYGEATFQVAGDIVLGDLTGDGLVTLLDVQPFVDLLLSGGFLPAADMNQDGVVNLQDVQPFIDAFDFP